MSDARAENLSLREQSSEQAPVHIDVNASNYGAIGVFQAPVYIYSYQPLTNQQPDPNREAMLKKVYSIWIVGLLERSLAHETRMALHLETHPDAVDVPLHALVQELNQPPLALSPDRPIIDAFKAFGGALLILGAPGSGKTTLLLELARALIADARQESHHRIPVVFNLSSWAAGHQPLVQWLGDELNTKYDVPRKVATTWIKQDMLLPLLDGLDEVPPAHRAACVDAINAYRQEYGFAPIAVCSRTDEYTSLTARLRLHAAVVAQPLTDSEILERVTRAGDQLADLRAALIHDERLRTLANTPLMLNILMMVYRRGAPAVETARAALDERRSIFDIYIDTMFQRRGKETRYSQEQIVQWLEWLAQRMLEHDQTVFYMEHMQPDWLPQAEQRRFRLYVGVLRGGLAGIAAGLFLGTLGLFLIGVFWPALWRSVGAQGVMVSALVGGIGFSAVFALVGLSAARRNGRTERIYLVERLVWSRASVSSRAVLRLRVMLIVAIVESLAYVVLFGAALGAVIGVISAILLFLFVFSEGASWREDEVRKTPNQGVWRSARNALLTSIGTGLGLGVAAGLVMALNLGGSLGSTYGIVFGLAFSVFDWLLFGGEAYMMHFLLRAMLVRNRSIPWRLARVLEVGVDRVLLRQVGGGYIFVHRLIMEHLASFGGRAQPTGQEF